MRLPTMFTLGLLLSLRWPFLTRLRTARCVRVLSTPLHLKWTCANAASYQTLSLLVQPWRRRHLTTVLSTRVCSSRPENLGRRGRTRPGKGVQVGAIDRLRPDGNLAAENIVRRRVIDGCPGVVRIHELPALGWRAPVVEWKKISENIVVKGEPLAATTIKILLLC